MVRSNLNIILLIGICVFGVTRVDAGNGGNRQCICDEANLVGAAYGACNRYCEALDCDAPNPIGSANACDRAMDRFFELTGDLPPCEPLCPCAEGWLNPEFIPDGEVVASCYGEFTENGTFYELVLEGVPDENGNTPLSVAAADIFDDDVFGYHRVGCFSERYENLGAEASDDSGVFEMQSSFREESARIDRQQRRIFKSCKSVLEQIIEKIDAECEVVDNRGE